jgi:hypothetical protein
VVEANLDVEDILRAELQAVLDDPPQIEILLQCFDWLSHVPPELGDGLIECSKVAADQLCVGAATGHRPNAPR